MIEYKEKTNPLKGLSNWLTLMKTVNVAKDVKDKTSIGYKIGNNFDSELENGIDVPAPKKVYEGMYGKYASENHNTFNQNRQSNPTENKLHKKWSKKKKTGVAVGSALAAAYVLGAISAGDAFAPISAIVNGTKSVPNVIFNKAKNGRFGNAAMIGAKGLDKAVHNTNVVDVKNIWDTAKKFSADGNRVTKVAKKSFSDFGAGLTLGGGVLAAHLIGDKLLKNKDVKKSYNSKALTNPGIDMYHKSNYTSTGELINDVQNEVAKQIQNQLVKKM